MKIHDPLGETLVDLAARLVGADIPLIVGGGYGLVLRREYLQSEGTSTLGPLLPARATEDLDLFLTAEVITDVQSMRALRDALNRMGFGPVPGAEFYQFSREVSVGGQSRHIKVDLLAQVPEDLGPVSMDARRIRPKGFREIHGHTTPEALTVHRGLTELRLQSPQDEASVYLPHPFSYFLLKLFALRDRHQDETQDFGRHHAFDIYQTTRMVTPEDWEEARGIFQEFRSHPVLMEGTAIRSQFFGNMTSIGTLRLREHARGQVIDLAEYPVEDFLGHLAALFSD